ncbi:INO80 [Hepatospora eriocheir]|uniref:Chromatin-remodeling ATPase INO80 n=1 Tax=Hepatospora eriocheir TaxID=1081669 RepID=A0A1X0QHN5_9MICR|nr:INO80 [Hepatospora eriocheir]
MINDKLKEKFCFIKKKMVDYTLPSLTSKSSPVKDLHSYVEKHTFIPPLDTFIKDSGKLITMEKLLIELKREDHRILIYFQMTRMMDLFEGFLTEREYSYLRLDGSSKISYRKDVVEKWQNDKSIFIFILSTRAGGVGLNLTAADTVIFYDSDWNPTVDQQAMDRVHRLGQTKNVTVYKLVVKDTIEERIMEMARKKDEIQKIVIQDDVFNG